ATASQRRFDRVRRRTRPPAPAPCANPLTISLRANVTSLFRAERLEHDGGHGKSMLRNRQALIPYLLLVAALAGGLLWHQSELVPGLGKNVITGRADVGGPFRLIDHTGKTVTDADFRGRYMLIYFGYSYC